MSKKIISFVVDADVARSSGVSEHPVSSGSRKLLQSLKESNHNAVMCPNLMKEWRRHKSFFATKWLASMIAKKKIIFISPAENIKNFIVQNIEDCKEKEIALKDSHLIDAALEVDKIVASYDNIAKNVFRNLSVRKAEIRSILWINPITDHEFIYDTLMSGGYIPKNYYLCAENLV